MPALRRRLSGYGGSDGLIEHEGGN